MTYEKYLRVLISDAPESSYVSYVFENGLRASHKSAFMELSVNKPQGAFLRFILKHMSTPKPS